MAVTLLAQVVIRRRPLFYTVNLLLPSIFLMVMDIVGFFLPPDSGERVSFKITLLLGYSVFLIIVSDTLPATAIGTPLIGKQDVPLKERIATRECLPQRCVSWLTSATNYYRGWLAEREMMRPWGKIESQLGCSLSM